MTEPTDKPQVDEPSDEQHLDEYLKGDSSVSRHYRQLPGADVPASLDRRVLRQAEDAVKRPSRPAWVRWTAPLAVAASAVLVVSIVMETGLRDETMVAAPAMQAERAPIETKMIDEAPEAASDATVVNEDVAHALKLEMPQSPPPQLAAPPPAAATAVAPQAAARARSVPPPAAPTPEPQAFPGGAVAYDAARAALSENAAKRAQSNNISFPQEVAAREEERSATAQAMRGRQQEVAGPRDTVDKPEPVVELSYSQAMNNSAVNNVATLQREYSDPEAWLKAIRQLRTENKQAEADREWHRFRTAFPNYEVAPTDSAREAKK